MCMATGEVMLLLIRLLAGTGVFLVGVRLLTANIEQLATSGIKKLFGKTAHHKWANVGIGAGITALIQSSGVTTVLIVGFVNVGVIDLYQATAMIMGANIGTTITAQVAALSAFPITTYIQVLTFVGMMITMIAKSENLKKTGLILAGLGLVFIGLSVMSDAMKGSHDAIQSVFAVIQNPFLLLFVGIALTALVQSSSVTTSVIIAMSVAGLTIGTGGNEPLYIILGTNIGSCVTALMSSYGAGANARRAGLIHLLFNTVGSVLFFLLLLCMPEFMNWTFRRFFAEPATQIAMFHTFFNVVCTLLFLPLSYWFVRITEILIPEEKTAQRATYLDDRIIASPSLAIVQMEKETMLLSDQAMKAFHSAYTAFSARDLSCLSSVQENIDSANITGQEIVAYLIKVSASCGTAEETRLTAIHNNIGDIMRIAEIADNFIKYTKRETEKNIVFSPSVKKELDAMVEKIDAMHRLTKTIILEKKKELLPEVDRLEDEIDAFRKSLIDGHIERLNRGECRAESSSIFINLVSNLERLGDHLTYIAHTVE